MNDSVAPGRYVFILSIVLAWFITPTHAAVDILSPADGFTVPADPCPVAPCTASIPFSVSATGAAANSVVIEFTADSGGSFEKPLCGPEDPIEQIPGCPDFPKTFSSSVFVAVGGWNLVARVDRDVGGESSPPVHIEVLSPNILLPGTISLSSVTPSRGAPKIFTRDPSPEFPDGIFTDPAEERARRIARATDAVRNRLGDKAVTRARLLRREGDRDDDDPQNLPTVD